MVDTLEEWNSCTGWMQPDRHTQMWNTIQRKDYHHRHLILAVIAVTSPCHRVRSSKWGPPSCTNKIMLENHANCRPRSEIFLEFWEIFHAHTNWRTQPCNQFVTRLKHRAQKLKKGESQQFSDFLKMQLETPENFFSIASSRTSSWLVKPFDFEADKISHMCWQ